MPQKVDSGLSKLFQIVSGALYNQPERRGIKAVMFLKWVWEKESRTCCV